MALACLEHINLTVDNPDQLAELFCELFNWKIRWSGPSKDQGYTVHVGSENRYFALYTHEKSTTTGLNYLSHGMVNHIGLVVNDAQAMEQRIINKGYETTNHRNYGVCRSFYFMADQTLEIEIVYYPEE